MARKLVGYPLLWLLFIVAVTACNNPTAAGTVAGKATASANLVGTAQADQYWRDAEATTEARLAQQAARTATFEADLRNVQITASSATGTAVAESAAATATAHIQQTRDTLSLTMTVDAATTEAQITQAAQTRLDAQETRAADQATQTAATTATAESMAVTREALAIRQAESEAHRQQLMATATSIFLISAGSILLLLTAWFFWQVGPLLARRVGVVKYGQHGNPLVLLTDKNGRTILTDPLRMLQSSVVIDGEINNPITMPELSPNALQTFIAGSTLQTLMEQARNAPGHPPLLPSETISQRRLGPYESAHTVRHHPVRNSLPASRQPDPHHFSDTAADNNPTRSLPYVVPWPALAQWTGIGMAIGSGGEQRQIIAVNPQATPHLFVAGTSGAGKTRRLLRPLAAHALNYGYYIVLMNEGGSDFAPFYDHPNVAVVRGSIDNYMVVVEAAYQEALEREEILRDWRISEWSRLPVDIRARRPPVLLAIDELLSLMVLLSPVEQKRFWRLLAAFASRARKVSMVSVGLATDPTYRVLGQEGLTYRSQCARLSFRLREAGSSRAILDQNGAETLREGEFLAQLEQPDTVQGWSAMPSDGEIISYLDGQPSPHLGRPGWLSLVTDTITPSPPVINLTATLPQAEVSPIADLAEQIRPLWTQMEQGNIRFNKSELARAVGQRYAGSWAAKIDAAILYLENIREEKLNIDK